MNHLSHVLQLPLPEAEYTQTIHCPGTIQPHGVLIAFSTPDCTILQVSSNIQAYFGVAPQALLGQPLSVLLGEPQAATVQQAWQENLGTANPLNLAIPPQINPEAINDAEQIGCQNTGEAANHSTNFLGIVHCLEEVALLELERSQPEDELHHFQLERQARQAIAKLQRTDSIDAFLQCAVTEVQRITGFDRVIAYQFDTQGAGCVMAEVKQPSLPAYLGLHFPDFDIPEASREIYRRCRLRCCPDLTVDPIPLVNLEGAEPLDLSFAILRSVDPCCVQFYRNMNSAAFLAIALIKERQLWGLISCHHQTPKALPYGLRHTCELLGQFISLELFQKVDRAELDQMSRFKALHSEFIESIAHTDNLSDALVNPAPRLLSLVDAQGAAVCIDNTITLLGTTPPSEAVQDLLTWTDTQSSESLFFTDSLPALYPKATEFKDCASGLLLLRISKVRRYSILWFRPEVLQTVNWGGNPNHSLQVAPDHQVTLCPRTSFDRWQEIVRFTSLPWKSYELTNALDLRNAIVGIVLKKADELAHMNRELERSNRELNSFAFAASHDLKEPLRGIHNYSVILQEDYEPVLDAEGMDCLSTIVRLSQRMDSLIDVLLRFSQLGQGDLNFKVTDLNQLLQQAVEVLQASRTDASLDIRIPRPLPKVVCDATLMGEVLDNLLSNAFKYNTHDHRWVEIGFLTADEQLAQGLQPQSPQPELPMLFYVRDNGIGIRPQHLEIIFKLFKRLHTQEEFGGGTGAGLTITRKAIERHGGRIWVESSYGEGSTFYFTLGALSS
ncbi:MAG TPA: ATP-binding protein [Stenomitos sp.]